MCLGRAILLLLVVFLQCFAEPQHYGFHPFYNDPQSYFFLPPTPLQLPSKQQVAFRSQGEGRFFFSTFTVTIATTTSTSTSIRVTTCTTSTAALSVCVAAVGRRRRGAFSETGRNLYYEESDESIFLPSPKQYVYDLYYFVVFSTHTTTISIRN